MKEYNITIDLECDLSQKRVQEICDFVKVQLKNSQYSNDVSYVDWDEY